MSELLQTAIQDADISDICAREAFDYEKGEVFNKPVAQRYLEQTAIVRENGREVMRTECAKCGQCVLTGIAEEVRAEPSCIYL